MPGYTVAPSEEVRAHARARAEALAAGLFPHQIDGLAFLLGRQRVILADDMGLGKTRQSILALTEARPLGPWLVVCPASVKQNWRREILTVLPDASVTILDGRGALAAATGWTVINYDLLGRQRDALLGIEWQGIVFDEAHYLKNQKSSRSRIARQIAESVPAASIHMLTGTPLTNRPRDLFPLLQLAGHPMARSFLSFAKRYCAAEHNGYGWVTDGASNLEELSLQLQGLMLRRRKEDVLDLPPKIRSWLGIEVPDGTARREARKVLELLLRKDQAAVAGADTRAARADILGSLTTARRKIAAAKVKQTIELIDDIVQQDEKVVVFSCFEDPVIAIADHFGAAAAVLTGSTPARKRQQVVDRFQQDPAIRVLVANIVAGGVGINLTAARQVVFNDLDWVPANHWQAEDRAYRIGQTATVNVHYLVATGTIDEFVASTLEAKAALIDAVVEGGALQDGDVFAALEAAVAGYSLRVAELSDEQSGEDPVDRLLREISRDFARKTSTQRGTGRLPLSADAIARLAEVLAGPTGARYQLTSARSGTTYTLEVAGTDITCSCPGFEYRGNCTHARTLRAALDANTAEAQGFSPI